MLLTEPLIDRPLTSKRRSYSVVTPKTELTNLLLSA